MSFDESSYPESSSWKWLHDVLEKDDGTVSSETLNDLLEKRLPSIRSLLSTFKISNTTDRQKLQNCSLSIEQSDRTISITKQQADDIIRLSDFLGMNELQAGQVYFLSNDMKIDGGEQCSVGNVDFLKRAIFFYFNERISLINTLCALLRNCEDSSVQYHAISVALVDKLLTAPEDFMENVVFKQYKDMRNGKLKLPERGLFSSEIFSADELAEFKLAYARQHFCEQRALLELMFLLLYSRVKANAQYACMIIELFTSASDVNGATASEYSLDSVVQSELHHIYYLESLISIEVFNLEELIEHDGSSQPKPWILDTLTDDSAPPQHTLLRLNRLIRRHCVHETHYSPLLLAWSIVLCRLWASGKFSPLMCRKLQVNDEDEGAASAEEVYWRGDENLLAMLQSDETEIYKLFASRAFALHLSEFIMQILSSDLMLHDAHPNVTGYKSVLKGLLIAFIHEFDLTALPEEHVRHFIFVFSRTMRAQPTLCYQYWVGDYSHIARRSPLEAALKRFPLDPVPFLQLICALSSISVDDVRTIEERDNSELNIVRRACQKFTYDYVSQLTMLTEEMADTVISHLEVTDINQDIMTVMPLQSILIVPWMQSKAFALLQRGVPIQASIHGEGSNATITWYMTYSGWQLFFYILQCISQDAFKHILTEEASQQEPFTPRDLSSLLYGGISSCAEFISWIFYAIHGVTSNHPTITEDLINASISAKFILPENIHFQGAHIIDVVHAVVEKHARQLADIPVCSVIDKHMFAAGLKCMQSLQRVYPTLSWMAFKKKWLRQDAVSFASFGSSSSSSSNQMYQTPRKSCLFGGNASSLIHGTPRGKPTKSSDRSVDGKWHSSAPDVLVPFHRIIRQVECAQGTYTFLRHFLEMIHEFLNAQVWCFEDTELRPDAFSQSAKLYNHRDQDPSLAIPVIYLTKEVYPVFLTWRYNNMDERYLIAHLLFQLITRVAHERAQWPLCHTGGDGDDISEISRLADFFIQHPMPPSFHALADTVLNHFLCQTTRTSLEPLFEIMTARITIPNASPALINATEYALRALLSLIKISQQLTKPGELAPLEMALLETVTAKNNLTKSTNAATCGASFVDLLTSIIHITNDTCKELSLEILNVFSISLQRTGQNIQLANDVHCLRSLSAGLFSDIIPNVPLIQTGVIIEVSKWRMIDSLIKTVTSWTFHQTALSADILIGGDANLDSKCLETNSLLYFIIHHLLMTPWSTLSMLPDDVMDDFLAIMQSGLALLSALFQRQNDYVAIIQKLIKDDDSIIQNAVENALTCSRKAAEHVTMIGTSFPWTFERILKIQARDIHLNFQNLQVESTIDRYARASLFQREMERDAYSLLAYMIPLDEKYLILLQKLFNITIEPNINETMNLLVDDGSSVPFTVLEEMLMHSLTAEHAAMLVKKKPDIHSFLFDVSQTYTTALQVGIDVLPTDGEMLNATATSSVSPLYKLLQVLVAFNYVTRAREIVYERMKSFLMMLHTASNNYPGNTIMAQLDIVNKCFSRTIEIPLEIHSDLLPLSFMNAYHTALVRDRLLVDLYLNSQCTKTEELDAYLATRLMYLIQHAQGTIATRLRSPWIEEYAIDDTSKLLAQSHQEHLIRRYVDSRESVWQTLLVSFLSLNDRASFKPNKAFSLSLLGFLGPLCNAITFLYNDTSATPNNKKYGEFLMTLLLSTLQLSLRSFDAVYSSRLSLMKKLEEFHVLGTLLKMMQNDATGIAISVIHCITDDGEAVRWLFETHDIFLLISQNEHSSALSEGKCSPGSQPHDIWCYWLSWFAGMMIATRNPRLNQDINYILDVYRSQFFNCLSDTSLTFDTLQEMKAVSSLLLSIADKRDDELYISYMRLILLLIQHFTFLLTHPLHLNKAVERVRDSYKDSALQKLRSQYGEKRMDEKVGISSTKEPKRDDLVSFIEQYILDIQSKLLECVIVSSVGFLEQSQLKLTKNVVSGQSGRTMTVLSLIFPSMRIALTEKQISLGVFAEGHVFALQSLQKLMKKDVGNHIQRMNDVMQLYMFVFYLCVGQLDRDMSEFIREARSEASSMMERTRKFYDEWQSVELGVEGRKMLDALLLAYRNYV